MALDRIGQAVELGQVYLLAGTVRHISGGTAVVICGEHGEMTFRVKTSDVIEVDDAAGGAPMIVDGSVTGSAVTEVPLSFGLLDMEPGLPGVPVERPTKLRYIAASFMATSSSAAWTATCMVRRSGDSFFAPVATYSIPTG